MSKRYCRQVVMYMLGGIAVVLFGCSSRAPTNPQSSFGIIQGRILRESDSAAVPQANIVLYNANTNAPIARTISGADGSFRFEVSQDGNYYLKVSAQGFLPLPPADGEAVSFSVSSNNLTTREFYLISRSGSGALGGISGYVKNGASGVQGALVIASSGPSGFSGVTGPDGYYVIYNVQAGDCAVHSFLQGYRQDTAQVTVYVPADTILTGVNVNVTNTALARITGKLSFISTTGATVDVTLVNPLTREAVPGIYTFNDSGFTYALTSVPPGSYIVWASYRNDGYVMDPDAIFKFGLPTVTVLPADTLVPMTQIIKITGAIAIVSPTNKPDSLFPEEVTTTTPLFKWTKGSSWASAKEFFVEVFDISGNSIWGGFDSTGASRLSSQILAQQDSVAYNFDNSAKQALAPGRTYRWKVYADNNAAPGVQVLLSSSEDLMGLFKIANH